MIRTEQVQDYPQIEHLLKKAFQGDAEARLVNRLRTLKEFEPELSLVAEERGIITGHIMFSYASIVDEQLSYQAAGLAPLAVDPSFQRTGIGGALIREGLERCRQHNIPLVFLIGHPSYYPRFGFIQAGDYGFEMKQFKVSQEVFMVYEIKKGALNRIKGEFRYTDAFLELE